MIKEYRINTIQEAANLIRSIVRKSVADAELRTRIYGIFGVNLDISKLYAWVKQNIRYVPDENNVNNPDRAADYFQEPKTLLKTRQGDCDDTAIFIATVLKVYGLKPIIKWVKFHDEKQFNHVYTCVDFGNSFYPLDTDPMINAAGQEVFHKEERIFEI